MQYISRFNDISGYYMGHIFSRVFKDKIVITTIVMLLL